MIREHAGTCRALLPQIHLYVSTVKRRSLSLRALIQPRPSNWCNQIQAHELVRHQSCVSPVFPNALQTDKQILYFKMKLCHAWHWWWRSGQTARGAVPPADNKETLPFCFCQAGPWPRASASQYWRFAFLCIMWQLTVDDTKDKNFGLLEKGMGLFQYFPVFYFPINHDNNPQITK